jgi:prepilin-type N-terminal cleavage/methylation domain-containing protein
VSRRHAARRHGPQRGDFRRDAREFSQHGFTLFEIVIVIVVAVIGILIGILTPRIVVHIDDANITRAQADANGIAAAIEKMYEDNHQPCM